MNFSFNLGGNGNRDYEINKSVQISPIGGIVFGVIITIIGIVATIFLYNYGKELQRKDKAFTETVATVVDNSHRTERDDDGFERDLYTPVFEYEVNGVKYRGESNTESSSKETIGKEIHIKYNPADPKDYILTSEGNFGSMYFLFGLVFVVAGIVVVVVNASKLGKTADQIKEFTEQLYDNDVDRLYGQPAEINSTITHNETPANINNINNNSNNNL